MPWERADTYWATAALVFWALLFVALAVWRVIRSAPVCVCEDSDRCTCGGAAGRPEFRLEPVEGNPALIVVHRIGYNDTIVGTVYQDRAQLLAEARERIVR